MTVVDDGSIADRRGSLTIDDEGTPTQRNILIEDGILKGYIHDRLNARLMGVEPTGNGRRESFAHAPMPRMTNTFMLGGKDDPGEILARAKNGIYAKSFGGGQVDITSGKFVFSCTEAYRIENGRLGAPIKGATLIGDGPTVLTRVAGDRQRHGARRGRRRLRQGRPVGARRRRPADPADRGPDGRRHRGVTAAWQDEVLDFWFGLSNRSNGGRRDPALDAEIRERFLRSVGGAAREVARGLPRLRRATRSPRSSCSTSSRATCSAAMPTSSATDPLALAIAQGAVEHGFDDGMSPAERGFLYMPFQHSEDLADQRRSVALFTALGDDYQLGFAQQASRRRSSGSAASRTATRCSAGAPRPAEVEAGDVVPW